MKAPSYKTIGLGFAALVCLAWAILSVAQEIKNSPEIPDKFQWDMQTAARLRADAGLSERRSLRPVHHRALRLQKAGG